MGARALAHGPSPPLPGRVGPCNGIWASASADLSLGSSFGYVAKGVGASIALDRAFSLAMSTGDVFALDLGLNYDAGSGGG